MRGSLRILKMYGGGGRRNGCGGRSHHCFVWHMMEEGPDKGHAQIP